MGPHNRRVLAIMAHPDDAELLCAGTLALLHSRGWQVYITTMTAGDCGTSTHSRKDIIQIRMNESEHSVRKLNGYYSCLGFDDLFITYDRESIIRLVGHIRQIRPAIVITMSPSCYLRDHEVTSQLAQTACFGGGLANVDTGAAAFIDFIPHLYYADPIEGKDKFGVEVLPTMVVDITSVMQLKTEMLACHESQREWLKKHHGMDEYIEAMKRFARQRGKLIQAGYGEGFRQHLGHAFPQDNQLAHELEAWTSYQD